MLRMFFSTIGLMPFLHSVSDPDTDPGGSVSILHFWLDKSVTLYFVVDIIFCYFMKLHHVWGFFYFFFILWSNKMKKIHRKDLLEMHTEMHIEFVMHYLNLK